MTTTGSSQILLRSMTLDDVPSVVAIEEEAFTSPWTKDAFINELTQNHFARYMVLLDREQIIGYGGMWVIIDEAHVTNIALRSAYRGRGLGEYLLTELQRTAVRFGAERMTLEVRASNEIAQRLYRKKGFEASGVRPGYYSDNMEDAIIMWAQLEQAGMENDDDN